MEYPQLKLKIAGKSESEKSLFKPFKDERDQLGRLIGKTYLKC